MNLSCGKINDVYMRSQKLDLDPSANQSLGASSDNCMECCVRFLSSIALIEMEIED